MQQTDEESWYAFFHQDSANEGCWGQNYSFLPACFPNLNPVTFIYGEPLMKRLTHPRPHKTELEKNIEKEDLSILQVEFSMHE
jgi:hypothetical protein